MSNNPFILDTMKIRSKLFAVLLSLILSSLLVTSFVSISIFSAAIMDEIRGHLEDNAAHLMNDISLLASKKISDAETMSRLLGNLSVSENEISDLAKALVTSSPNFEVSPGEKGYSSISVYDANGLKIADVKDSSSFGSIDLGSNITNTPYYDGAIRGKIYQDTIALYSAKNNTLVDFVVALSAPIFNSSQEVATEAIEEEQQEENQRSPLKGVLILTYPLKTLLQQFTNFSPLSNKNTNLALLSNNSTILYANFIGTDRIISYGDNNSAVDDVGRLGTVYPNQEIINQINESNQSVISRIHTNEIADRKSEDAIFVAAKAVSSSSPLAAGETSDGWNLVTSLSTNEAFREMLNFRTMFLIITVIVIAISAIVIYYISRKISKPLIHLRDSATAIANGNLEIVVKHTTNDEVGELASQFERLRINIKDYIENLLKKDEELETANRSLVDAEKSKDEFISMVSHELKTPIVPIKLYAEMLLRSTFMGTLNEKQHRAADIIHKSINRLEVLVNDVLDVYKLELGKLRLSKIDVNIVDLVREIISNLMPLTYDKNVTLEMDLKKVSGVLNCDPTRIEQVLANLIKNSIDFVSDYDGKIIVRVEESSTPSPQVISQQQQRSIDGYPSSYFLFTIEDNGPGIPKEKIDSLFQKFYQIDTSVTRKHGGTGLGLVICKGIVEAHGGKIWIDRDYANGACIRFTLPYEKENECTRRYT